jgi:hypothetical protein
MHCFVGPLSRRSGMRRRSDVASHRCRRVQELIRSVSMVSWNSPLYLAKSLTVTYSLTTPRWAPRDSAKEVKITAKGEYLSIGESNSCLRRAVLSDEEMTSRNTNHYTNRDGVN